MVKIVSQDDLTTSDESGLVLYNGDPFSGITKCDMRIEIAYYQDGRLHREDGPAIEWETGRYEWYHHGKRHRDDGPAVDGHHGYVEWYHYGKRHRDINEWAKAAGIYDTDTFTLIKLEWGH